MIASGFSLRGLSEVTKTWSAMRAAIFAAVAHAEDGDVVVIAGKGHEQGQEFAGGEKIPFDDVTVAREALREALGEVA